MTPISHYPPVTRPDDYGPGHWEYTTDLVNGKLIPVDLWIVHCHYHPFIEMRNGAPCERCAKEPERQP